MKKVKTDETGSYRYLDVFTDTALVNLINAAKAMVRNAPKVTTDRHLARLARTVAVIEREEKVNKPTTPVAPYVQG